MMSKKYSFKPALIFPWLTPLYDAYGDYTGLRKSLQNQAMSVFQLKDGWKVLDVGAGSGADLILLQSLYPQMKLTGIDADPQIVAIAKKKMQKLGLKIKIKEAFAEELPFFANSFDAVWSDLTLHHMPTDSKKKAIREIYRVLKPGGRFFLIECSKPKNSLIAKLILLQNLVAYTKDNYEEKIPIFMREANFINLKERKFGFHMSFFQADKKR